LYLLVTQLSPQALKDAGVPLFTTIQEPGQFVVTCPRAYHAGFNTGLNVAESVNFALEDWLPICRLAVDAYRFNRSAVFPYEEFVLRAAARPDSLNVGIQLYQELELIVQREQKLQYKIFSEGINQFISMPGNVYRSCQHCGYDCFISGVLCNTHPTVVACLHHAAELCPCGPTEKRLLVRVHLLQLKKALDGLKAYILHHKQILLNKATSPTTLNEPKRTESNLFNWNGSRVTT